MKSYGLFMAGTLETDPTTPSELTGSFTGSFTGSIVDTTSGSIGDLEVVRLTETSAQALKTNIQTLDSSDALFNLRPVRFNWRHDNREDIGLIAEEVNELYPELVKSTEQGAAGVNYSKLTSVLIKAVQDLSVRISNLEKK